MSPLFSELSIEPGKEYETTVYLENDSNYSISMSVKPVSIRQKLDGNFEYDEALDKKTWFSLMPQKLDMNPKSSRAVKVKVRAPRGASGTQSLGLLLSIGDSSNSSEVVGGSGSSGSFKVLSQLIPIIVASVKDTINRPSASIVSVNLVTQDERVAKCGPDAIGIACRLKNTGKDLVRATGSLFIVDERGRRVKEAPLGRGVSTILPGATVDLLSIFTNGLPDGTYRTYASIAYGSIRPIVASAPFTLDRSASRAQAESVMKMTQYAITPEVVAIKAPRGALRNIVLTVVSSENEPLRVALGTAHLDNSPTSGLIPVRQAPNAWSAYQWLSLPKDMLEVRQERKSTFRLAISVPKDAVDGTYYASLIALGSTADANPTAMSELLIPVVISVGESEGKIDMSEIMIERNDDGGLSIKSIIKNIGNKHTAIKGALIIKRRRERNEEGIVTLQTQWELIDDIDLSGMSGWLLPGASVPIAIPYDGLKQSGTYMFELVMTDDENNMVQRSVEISI